MIEFKEDQNDENKPEGILKRRLIEKRFAKQDVTDKPDRGDHDCKHRNRPDHDHDAHECDPLELQIIGNPAPSRLVWCLRRHLNPSVTVLFVTTLACLPAIRHCGWRTVAGVPGAAIDQRWSQASAAKAREWQGTKWRHKSVQELVGKDGGPIETRDVSDIEKKRRVAALILKIAARSRVSLSRGD